MSCGGQGLYGLSQTHLVAENDLLLRDGVLSTEDLVAA
jgi:hypothetical protein